MLQKNIRTAMRLLVGLILAFNLYLLTAFPTSYAEITFSSLVSETKESLEPYIALLGIKTTSTDLEVTNSFLEGIDKVMVMGNEGTIEHGYTDLSTSVIDIMDWSSHESFSDAQFDMFALILNEYLGKPGIIHSYANYSEKTYVWNNVDNCQKVICWLDDQIITIRWYYEETESTSVKESPSTSIAKPTQTSNPTNSNKRFCIEEGCSREATKSIIGISGVEEYYCSKHYKEIIDILDGMLNSFGK